MKKIQLIKKLDYDGDWFIIRTIDENDRSSDKHFKASEIGEKEARKFYAMMVENAESVRKETLISEYVIPEKVNLDAPALEQIENSFTPDQN